MNYTGKSSQEGLITRHQSAEIADSRLEERDALGTFCCLVEIDGLDMIYDLLDDLGILHNQSRRDSIHCTRAPAIPFALVSQRGLVGGIGFSSLGNSLPIVHKSLGDGLQTVVRESIFVVAIPGSLESLLDPVESTRMTDVTMAARRRGRCRHEGGRDGTQGSEHPEITMHDELYCAKHDSQRNATMEQRQ